MATGTGKTFTAVSFVYRLIKHAKARRVLFLVDRNNLGRQAFKEFDQYLTPDDGRKFTELYNVQHLQSNVLDPVSKVHITTIQRLYSMLSGEPEFDPENEERSLFDMGAALDKQPPKADPATTRHSRSSTSISSSWTSATAPSTTCGAGAGILRRLPDRPDRHALQADLRLLQAEPGHGILAAAGGGRRRQRAGRGLSHPHADQQRAAARWMPGFWIGKRDRQTRLQRWEQLDDDFAYDPNQLDREVVSVDQIRTILRTFRDRLFTEMFPRRTDVPKTLIFAKDDSHAEDIVRIVREEFGKGNEFCQKITYQVTGGKPEDLINDFRNSYNPRIAVTVDMIATGTDIKPAGGPAVHARGQVAPAVRADAGPRHARRQPHRAAKRDLRRLRKGSLRPDRRGGHHGPGVERPADIGAEALRVLQATAGVGHVRHHRRGHAQLACRPARKTGKAPGSRRAGRGPR